jgi:hypothetical protein
LPGNAFEGAGCEVVTWLTSNRNPSRLLWMLELPVAAAGGDKHPASSRALITSRIFCSSHLMLPGISVGYLGSGLHPQQALRQLLEAVT